MKGWICILTLMSLVALTGMSLIYDPVLEWIEKGQTEQIETYLEDNPVDALVGSPGTTLLVHSVLHGSPFITEWLVSKGADINLPVNGMSPLMYALQLDEEKKVSILLSAGADVGFQDPEGNTALFYAAISGNLKSIKSLLKHGADISHKNLTWHTAYDLAIGNNNQQTATFLRDRYEKNLPDLLDGPYIRWHGKKKIRAFYLVHDSRSQITRRNKARFKASSDPFPFRGFSGDTLDYLIHSRRDVSPDSVQDAEKILVLGDIHGGYDSLVLFLQQNGILNSSLQWDWGKGHLVFVGDIFDRGDKVTEALWLIYRLEDQAARAGGAVHYILGNHEIMVLTGNLNYVSDKYLLMTSKLNIDYSGLFSKRTVLGQWLRTRNAVVRINGYLFVHAGLSPDIIKPGTSLHEINNRVHSFLNGPERNFSGESAFDEVFGTQGPFWYRGYLEDNREYPHLPQKELQKILDHFDVRTIFIGHTNVQQVTSIYNGKVFAIDVPFYTYGYPIQGLLLKDGAIYRLNSSGVKEQIR